MKIYHQNNLLDNPKKRILNVFLYNNFSLTDTKFYLNTYFASSIFCLVRSYKFFLLMWIIPGGVHKRVNLFVCGCLKVSLCLCCLTLNSVDSWICPYLSSDTENINGRVQLDVQI